MGFLSRPKLPFVAIAALTLAAATVVGVPAGRSRELQVRPDRWLEVRQVVGQVTFLQRGQRLPGQVGQRLQQVGDGLQTGQRSRSVLAVDTGIGFIDVSENTALRVQEMRMAPDGGRVTRLQVSGGQARLRVRPFNRRGSRLEVETPAGLSGVRGTEFGVSVQPDGKTGVATLEGRVDASAEGATVAVGANLQTLIVPGEPPTPPVPLRDDPRLDLQQIESAQGGRAARIVGRLDPVNLLLIEDQPQVVPPDGQFSLEAPLRNGRITAIVITPLGKRQTYELALP
ncbi:FecR domain-containing protein [Geitlerinema sp. PCC 7407]|uniref:FecR family protein n=1 Tax=Geitlerinema sp. PCC 7407 TaxID=1173025 RepID=UPI00029FF837|nr:FecR family protein [Geitlerinema sp. PCC 7407]AFY65998.1 FecR family protein [Geitlerinema sp. PCC 7407]